MEDKSWRNDPRFHPPFYPPFGPPEPWPLPAEFYRPFLEAQRSFLLWYQNQLQHHDNGFDDRLRESLNALMASWLDAVKTFREQQEQGLRAQSELVTRYLDILDQLLSRTDERKT